MTKLTKKQIEIRKQVIKKLNITFDISNNIIKTRCKKCKKFH